MQSAHTPNRNRPRGLALLTAIATIIAALASGLLAGSALADGDPASDVLASQSLFLPQDAGLRPEQQARLGALLGAAQRSGYQLRVALIASPADLGSVTELWHQPQSYAQFLGQELSLVYRGSLLVVMPNGYGEYRFRTPVAGGPSPLAGVPGPGSELGKATLTAIQRLASAAGHSLPPPAAIAPSRSGSGGTLSWAVFGIGSALILLAWGASLRARPLRLGRHGTSSA